MWCFRIPASGFRTRHRNLEVLLSSCIRWRARLFSFFIFENSEGAILILKWITYGSLSSSKWIRFSRSSILSLSLSFTFSLPLSPFRYSSSRGSTADHDQAKELSGSKSRGCVIFRKGRSIVSSPNPSLSSLSLPLPFFLSFQRPCFSLHQCRFCFRLYIKNHTLPASTLQHKFHQQLSLSSTCLLHTRHVVICFAHDASCLVFVLLFNQSEFKTFD